jgi:hypothetical protein
VRRQEEAHFDFLCAVVTVRLFPVCSSKECSKVCSNNSETGDAAQEEEE